MNQHMANAHGRAAADELLPPGMTRLGMGCGDLYGGAQHSQSARLVQAAFDAGIRYFDVARLYGNGSAEGVLGSVLKPVRGQVVIATKAGIVPWSMQLGKRLAYKAAVAGRALGPLARNFVPEPRPPAERYGAFGSRDLQRSIECSLKALQTDYIDVLLLHECTPSDARADETLSVLQRFLRAGQIRAFGIATHYADTVRILQDVPGMADVAQIPSDAFSRNVLQLPAGHRLVVTHSALKHALPRLKQHLAACPAAAARWQTALGVSPSDTSSIARILIGLAREDNEGGVVLFSTSHPERITEMVQKPFAADILRTARDEISRMPLAG